MVHTSLPWLILENGAHGNSNTMINTVKPQQSKVNLSNTLDTHLVMVMVMMMSLTLFAAGTFLFTMTAIVGRSHFGSPSHPHFGTPSSTSDDPRAANKNSPHFLGESFPIISFVPVVGRRFLCR